MSASSDERVTGLEIASAEQERAIEELSKQIVEQWAVIDRLQRKLDILSERFLALEERTEGDIPVTKPPHY
jgi:SlyX protein